MEGQGVAVDLDISALRVRSQDSRSRPVYGETELLQTEVLGGSVCRNRGERGVGTRSICRGRLGRVFRRSRLLCGLSEACININIVLFPFVALQLSISMSHLFRKSLLLGG